MEDLDTELLGQRLFIVYVYLADLDLGLFFGDFIDDGRKHLARPAPGGPEIDEDDALGREDFLLKIRCCNRSYCHIYHSLG